MAKHIKNNVSYFFAGYKAALARKGDLSIEDIEFIHYTKLQFHNHILKALHAYDSEEDAKLGLAAMYKEIEKESPTDNKKAT